MVWGSGDGPENQGLHQPGHGGSQSPPNPSPYSPYPTNQASTPPYPYPRNQAPATPTRAQPAPNPLQRLAEVRRSASQPARQSADPDGTPARLPVGVGGVAGRVVQRFSGSGLAPKTKVQRQEGRARRTTLILAFLAVLLIAASATLIFNPSIELPSFGFALNQRVHKQYSDVSLYVDGTQPPTPTSSAASPSPTSSSGSNGGPTSHPTPSPTARPTATPQPTATPSPTPTVIPTGAVVRFTATRAQISKNSFTGCGSGCDFQTASNSASGPLSSGGSYGPSGWQSTQVKGPYNVTQTVGRYCYSPISGQYKCVTSYAAWNPGAWNNPGFTMSSSNFSCSGIKIPGDNVGNAVQSSYCWWNTNQNPVYANSFCGTTNYSTPPASDGSWYIFFFNFCNAQWNSSLHYTYVTSTDCNNAIGNADPNAKNAANSAAASWIGSRVNLYETSAPINNSSVRYCSPGVGAQNTSTRGFVAWSWSATAFDPNATVSAAAAWVQSQVPAGYVLTAGPNTCSASQAGSSFSYSGGYNGTVTVTCAATGTATYDWTSATQGMNAQNALKTAIEGQTLSQAQAICNNNYPGIVAGSCTIQLVGGNVNIVPSNPNEIQIQPS